MSGGVHPEVVNDNGGWGFAYVFADEAEVCSLAFAPRSARSGSSLN